MTKAEIVEGLEYLYASFYLGTKINKALKAAIAALSAEATPFAYALVGAVGGDELAFQSDDLLDSQNRYGGEIVELYRPSAPAADGWLPIEPTPKASA